MSRVGAGGWAQQVADQREVWGRAPSAHNTQPWVVTPDGDRLLVGWDEQRHLVDGDPTRRDLLLSLGCVVEALAITAAHLGHEVKVTWDVDVSTRHAATMSAISTPQPLEPQASGPRTPAPQAPGPQTPAPQAPGPQEPGPHPGAPLAGTIDELLARRTARSAYEQPPTDQDVSALTDTVALPAGAALEVVPARWVARWLPIADEWTLTGPAADELAGWLRLSRRHPQHDVDGLTAEALGLTKLEAMGLRVALRPRVRAALQRFRLTRLLAAQATARPLGTVVALTAPPGLHLNDLGALGRTLLRVWLAAGRHGWSVHPLSALLDCPTTAAAWGRGTDWVDVAGTQPGTPYAVFRLGVPTGDVPQAARR